MKSYYCEDKNSIIKIQKVYNVNVLSGVDTPMLTDLSKKDDFPDPVKIQKLINFNSCHKSFKNTEIKRIHVNTKLHKLRMFYPLSYKVIN